MATAEVFARRMRVLGRRVEVNSNKTVVKAALLINQAVVSGTPVDTGQARGGWLVGINSAPSEVSEELDPSGGATISRNESKIRRVRGDQTVHIVNNVGHIGFLNDGSSSQAPAGFVEAAVNQAQNQIKRARILIR